MTHVMIDIETLGTRPGSIILSIGAQVFDPASGNLGDTFYANIDPASCRTLGMTEDASTVKWWSEQSLAARDALKVDQKPLPEVLSRFTSWWSAVGGEFVWGHGANFDVTLMECAFDAALSEAPWKFWSVRCCRTVLALANRRPDRKSSDVAHNALHDAQAQARAVAAALRYGQFNA